MSILLESFWIWIGLAFVVGALGYMVWMNDPKPRTFGIAVGAVLLVLALGMGLYYGVDTDRKSISRMLTGLAETIEKDDLEGVLKYISPKAMKTRGLARANMGMVRITSAKFKDLKIEVNELVTPPSARVTFTAVVYWKTKEPIEGFALETPQLEFVRFDVELDKTNDNSWLVTDNCDFKPRATN